MAGKARPSEYNHTVTYLLQYLENTRAKCPVITPDDFLNSELLITAFGYRAAYGVAQVAEEIDRNGRSWNSMLVDISRISKAHCQYMLVRYFFVGLQQENELGANEKQVLQTMAYFFALHLIDTEAAEFLVSGYLSSSQVQAVKRKVIELLAVIRPDAVALVDAFALPDYYLNSALGRYDGNVYEAMTKMAEKEPLNQTVVVDGYEECIKPFVHARL